MMNSAAGLVSGSPLQMAQQGPPDAAEPEAACSGDFMAILAAAATEEPEAAVPDGMQSAAALALLAGLLNAGRPAEPPPPAADTLDGASDILLATNFQGGDQAVPVAASNAVSIAGPLGLMRTFGASVPRDAAVGQEQAPVAATGDAPVADITLIGQAVAVAAAEPGSMGERQISALLERASAHAGAAGFDQQSIAGPNLYTNTRDAVASAAGPVSSLPEAVHSAVGSPRWANELGSRLLVMSVRGQQEGSLSLTPEHLGPLEVRISVSQDTTSIWFGAQHADTRAALTDALPRLRELFAASGLALGHAGVSHDMPRQDARRSEVQVVGSGDNPGAAEAAPVAPVGRHVRSVLLDAWA
jgi:hypothetical protein